MYILFQIFINFEEISSLLYTIYYLCVLLQHTVQLQYNYTYSAVYFPNYFVEKEVVFPLKPLLYILVIPIAVKTQ